MAKPGLMVLLGHGKPEDDADDGEEDGSLMKDFIDAVHDKDAEVAQEAFKALLASCRKDSGSDNEKDD